MQFEPDTSKEAVGNRLRAIRMARGWESGFTAQLVGVLPQSWSNYEAGKAYPSFATIAKLWQLTGATSDFILFGNPAGMPHGLFTAVLPYLEPQPERRTPARRRRRRSEA